MYCIRIYYFTAQNSAIMKSPSKLDQRSFTTLQKTIFTLKFSSPIIVKNGQLEQCSLDILSYVFLC